VKLIAFFASRKRILPLCSLIIAILIVLFFYAPQLSPILDKELNFFDVNFFNRIDTTTYDKRNFQLFTFDGSKGVPATVDSRNFLIGGGMFFISGFLGISDAQVYSIILLISILLGLYGLYRMIKIFEKDEMYRALLLFPIALFYFLNLLIIERVLFFWIWASYAVLPLFLSFGISYIQGGKNRDIIVYAILFSAFGIIPHSFIFYVLVDVFLILYCLLGRYRLRKLLVLSIVPAILYGLINSPFFLTSPLTEGYPYKMSLDQFSMFSRNGELINVLTFSNNWWPLVPSEMIFDNLAFRLSSFAILICVLLFFIISLRKSNRIERIISSVSLLFVVIVILFLQGTNNPLVLGILRLLGENHLLDLLAPLRDIGKLSILLPIFFIIILILGFTKFQGRQKLAILLVLSVIIGTNIVVSPSSSYLNSVYSPTYLPEEYHDLSRDIPVDHKTLYIYPTKATDILGYWRYEWNPEKSIGDVIEKSIGSSYPTTFDLIRLMNVKEPPPVLLDALNIEYVIKRTDILGASDFMVDYDWLNSHDLQYLTLLENDANLTPFVVYPHGILREPDATGIYSLVWGTKGLTVAPLSTLPDGSSPDFILPESIPYSIYQGLSSSKDTVVLEPFTFSYRVSPETTWSKSTTSDTLHTEWHPYLEQFGIENWQSDYGRGLVCTWGNSTQSTPNDLKINFDVKNSTNYHLLTRFFQNCKGGSVNLFLDNNELTLNTSDELNKFIWEDLGEFYLEMGGHSLTIRNIEGFNAFNLFVIVPSQELQKIKGEVEDSLGNRTMINILEAESDMYSEGAFSERESDASNGELLTLLDGKAWQNFDTLRDGPYTIALNLKGTFNVKVDNSTYTISSDSLDLRYIDPINLTKGAHLIQVTPANPSANWGFNEQDVQEWRSFTLEDQFGSSYRIYWDQTEGALRADLLNSTWGWKTIDSPLVPVKQNTTYRLNFSVKASNGFAVHYKIFEYNSSRQYINNTYAYIGDGSFDWKNISYNYTPSDPSISFIQLQVWHGHETTQSLPNTLWIRNVTIYEGSNQLDVIWAYPANNPLSNSSLQDLFSTDEAPAIVKNYTRVNPTLWKLDLDSKRPFILSFAESYEPQWEARVYKDGRLLEKAYSFPLYDTINGFWINSTGSNLEVEIVYTSQDSFNLGLAISGVTLLSLLVYLSLDFIRRRMKYGAFFFQKKNYSDI